MNEWLNEWMNYHTNSLINRTYTIFFYNEIVSIIYEVFIAVSCIVVIACYCRFLIVSIKIICKDNSEV